MNMLRTLNWDQHVHIWTFPQSAELPDDRLHRYLASCLGLSPECLSIFRDNHGKPYLSPPYSWLQFNLTHSQGRVVLVAARDATPGVDIENLSRRLTIRGLAARFFTPAESLVLQQCSPAIRKTVFLQLWCHKEAVLKAHGMGIAFGLQKINFQWLQSAWTPHTFHPAIGSAADWQVHDLALGNDWVGCVAWRGPPLRITLHAG